MGGGRYDLDVGEAARSTEVDVFAQNQYLEKSDAGVQLRKVHPTLDPRGVIRECMNETPIVVAMDVTRSRGEDTKVMYEKLPMFIGQIELKAYVSGAAISFAAVGDAACGDRAPLQVGQFEADNRLDEALSRIWIEEGGGGTGQESYELAAYFYARHSKLACAEQGKKGYFFFLGDEGFYPRVSAAQIRSVLGREEGADVDSAAVFAELQRKYHTFLLFPRKTMQERMGDIDAEIKQRVVQAGGRHGGVDIRASLLWNNRNDLDLHMITPSGEHIYFGHKRARCGGWLDVDMNVHGETTKPVENIQYAKGTAPAGRYRVFVHNFRFHERDHAPTWFKVELEVNGRVQHFEGTISLKGETNDASEITVFEFDYDPNARVDEKPAESVYASYSDDVILAQWSRVLPPSHILKLDDPKAVIDVMLGVLAIVGGTADLERYLDDMKGREQRVQRQEEVARTLGDLAAAVKASRAQVTGELPPTVGAPQRGGRSRRL